MDYDSSVNRKVADHPARAVIRAQGRRQTWVAQQLKISPNYWYRLLLPSTHPDYRPPPDWFYPRLAALLGVPEDMIRPVEKAKDEPVEGAAA